MLVTGCRPWNPMYEYEVLPKIVAFCNDYKYPSDVQISNQYKKLIEGCLKIEEKDRFDWH